jgi:hypothetical protein
MWRKATFLICLAAVLGLAGGASAEEYATNPSPPNKDWCVPADTMLGWTKGDNATSHDVYFGIDFNDVNDANTASSGVYRGSFPVDQNYSDPGVLQKAKTYYWRVDEVGATTVKGEVWSFATASAVCVKVDLAIPDCPDTNIVRPETAKPGWWIWACDGWADMYRCDHCWEEGIENGPKPTGPGIAGTGIHAGITVFYEGDGGFKVGGLTGALAGGLCPTGSPLYEAICNSWYYGMDWPEGDGHSIQLALHDLPGGAYTLYSFHNHFGCYRVPGTDDPTEARYLPYQDEDPFHKLFPGIDWTNGPFPEGVVSLQEAYDVQPQQVTSDEELVPSVVKFTTNGNPLLVIYRAGCCQPDPVRPTRVGGRGILNAFVLQFTPLVTAYAPYPSDGEENVSPDVELSWVAGEKAQWHDVFFGTNYADVRDANTADQRDVYAGRQPLADTNYAPGLLEYGRTYYWKADEVNDNDTNSPWYGDVWSFTVYQPCAANPSPPDGSKDLSKEGVQLGWSPGYVADSHDLYLGTNLSDVTEATTSSDVFIVNYPLATTTYETGPLVLGKTYYWRIDERSSTVGPYFWKGDVWEFTVEKFLVVEDFEDYDATTNLIYDTWLDGLREWPPANGAIVGLGIDPCNPVHGGLQSMEYIYDSTGGMMGTAPYYSEAERTITDPCDWTVFGVKILKLWFYGDPANTIVDTDQMYVGVEDSTGPDSYAQVRYGDTNDMNDVKVAEWHEWNVELQEFANGGVNLEDVTASATGSIPSTAAAVSCSSTISGCTCRWRLTASPARILPTMTGSHTASPAAGAHRLTVRVISVWVTPTAPPPAFPTTIAYSRAT